MDTMVSSSKFSTTTQMYCENCCNCGVLFAMTQEHHDELNGSGKTFYCTNGHPQHYTYTREKKLNDMKSERDMYLRWYESAQQDLKHEQSSKRAYKGQLTKLKKRAYEGKCPCCEKSFKDLEKHMKGQHPEFVREPDGDRT